MWQQAWPKSAESRVTKGRQGEEPGRRADEHRIQPLSLQSTSLAAVPVRQLGRRGREDPPLAEAAEYAGPGCGQQETAVADEVGGDL